MDTVKNSISDFKSEEGALFVKEFKELIQTYIAKTKNDTKHRLSSKQDEKLTFDVFRKIMRTY